jgi:16S rRNA (cytosine967-C5)-methyltransferase
MKETTYPADRFLGNFFHQHRRKFGSRDRRFISEIIYSIFRNKLYFEMWAAHCNKHESEFLVLLAAGLEGLLSAEDWNSLKTTIALDKLQAYSFPSSASRKDLSVRYSCPEWLVQKWTKQFGEEEARLVMESIQNRPPFVIRANTLKKSREELAAHWTKRGYDVTPTELSATGIRFKDRVNLFDSEEFRDGWFEIQDEGSQLVCEKVAPVPGEIIWDVCAGAGGKSLALAALMQNKGRIIATDIREKKLDDLRKRAQRAGVSNIFPADLARLDELKIIRNGIDKIVVDAPCSGTGTLRRNPDAKWKLKEEKFTSRQAEQLEIVEKALPRLKPGGRVYYVTCSLEPEENEQVVLALLEKHPELRLIPAGDSPDGFLHLMPHRQGTDGFFLAIAEKTK